MTKRRSTRCWSRWRALTLVELVAALAILGVLLAGMLTAQSRLRRQWVSAEETLAAAAVVDALMEEWTREEGEGVPVDQRGEVRPARPGELGWIWQTRVVDGEGAAGAERLGAEVVRVSVYRNDRRRVGVEREPAVSVEVLVAVEEDEREWREVRE